MFIHKNIVTININSIPFQFPNNIKWKQCFLFAQISWSNFHRLTRLISKPQRRFNGKAVAPNADAVAGQDAGYI